MKRHLSALLSCLLLLAQVALAAWIILDKL